MCSDSIQHSIRPRLDSSTQRVLERCKTTLMGPFFFHVAILIAIRILKSFNVVFKHNSDQFNRGEPYNVTFSRTGSALNIDLREFYIQLYGALLQLDACELITSLMIFINSPQLFSCYEYH